MKYSLRLEVILDKFNFPFPPIGIILCTVDNETLCTLYLTINWMDLYKKENYAFATFKMMELSVDKLMFIRSLYI